MKQFKGKKIKAILAYLLCVAMIFENAGFTVYAEESQVSVVEGISEGDVVSDGDIAIDDDVTSNNNVLNEGNTTTVASGVYYGMNWSIDSNNLLTISGVYDANERGEAWKTDYEDVAVTPAVVTSVKVTATGVTSMRSWFFGMDDLKQVDFSDFDSSEVTDMSYLFESCSALESLDLSDLDTSQVTNMSGMFSYCENLVDVDLSSFKTGQAKYMYDMFNGCKSLVSINLSNFDTTNVINMSSMFRDCEKLATVDLSNFNTSNVNVMYNMFKNCQSLTTLEIDTFDTSNVYDMRSMFYGCSTLTSLDLSSFDMISVEESAEMMLAGCVALQTIKTPQHGNYVCAYLPCIYADDSGKQYTKLPSESVSLKKAEDVIASGTYYGMKWIINNDGKLTISGEYNSENSTGVKWTNYKDYITSVTVTAIGVKSVKKWFWNCVNITEIDFSNFDTSQIDSMRYMFYNCSALTELELGNFNTSQVTDMYGMFQKCSNLKKLDLSSFDCSNVVFAEDEDTGDVIGIDELLSECNSLELLKTPYNLNENVSLPVTMYDEAGKEYTSLPADMTASITLNVNASTDSGDISDGDVTSGDVTSGDVSNLIASGTYCEGVTWTLSVDGVLTVEGTAADSLTADLGNYTRGWADYAQQITSAKVNVKGVKSFYQFFYGCSNLQSVDFTGTDTSDAENMAFMFYGCSTLKTLDVSGFKTGNVTVINSMFSGCSSLESLDVTGFDTSKATSLGGMFNGCESLKSMDVSGFKTEQVTNLSLMFKGCKSLQELDLSNFNTEKVFDTNQMFYGCSGLISLDLSKFDTSSLKLVDKMFSGCTSLESIDMSSWSLASVYEGTGSDAFKDCNSLKTIKAPKALGTEITLPCTMYTDAGIPYTALPLNAEASITLYKENPSGNALVAFGKYYGMDWTLDDKGALIISGTYDAAAEGTSWDAYREDVVSVKVTASGVTDTSNWFKDMIYLENVDVSAFDTSSVRYMNYMFYNCSSLTELDLSNCSINAIYGMNSMFAGCTGLSELKFAEGTKTGSLMDMTAMFKDCKSLEELDMSSFWMGYLVNYDNAFSGMESLSVLHTPTYVVESVALPHGMYDATGQVNYFLPLWLEKSNTLTIEKPTDESVVAYGVYNGMDWALNGDGVLNISGTYDDSEEGTSWSEYSRLVRTVKVTATGVKSTKSWFYYMSNLQNCDFSAFDTSQVTDMSQMFFGCTSLTKLDVTGFNTSNVTDMSNMFAYCRKLESLDVSSFKTSKVTSMQSIFSNCEKLEHIAVSGFDTSNVTDFGGMFMDCHALKYVDVSGFDTSKATRMSYLFCGCSLLEELDLSHFKTSNVEDMRYMFFECLSLKTLDVSGFDTGKVTNMDSMFRKCESLTSIELSNFNTAAVEDMYCMFADSAFKKLDLSSFSVANVTDADYMLLRCNSLMEIKAPCYLNLEVDLPYDMVDEAGNVYDTLPLMTESSVLLKQSIWGIAPIAAQQYTGKAIKPEVTVMYGNVELTNGVDYTVSYKNNINAASADAKNKSGKSIAPTVIVKGKGNYTGTVQTTFEIEQVDFWDVRDEMVVTGLAAYENGKVQKNFKPTVMLNGRKLQYNKDFYVYYYYYDNEDAYKVPGTYSVSIEGIGNYTGSNSVDLTILAKDQVLASKLKVGKIPTYNYEAGNPARPTPAVSYKGEELVLGRDYSISYENNSKPGKASLIITGLENNNGVFVAGTVIKTFTIKGTAISKAKVNYNNKATFTGGAICPAVTLTVGKGDAAKTLRPYYDYTVSYLNNVKAGKGTIVISGCGEYTGTVKKTFTIQTMPVAEADVNVAFAGGIAEAAYAQSGAKPEITVTVGGVVLVAGKDYTVSYKNNKKLAKVAEVDAKKAPTVVLKGKGNYKFTKNVTFDVVQMDIGNLVVSAKDMTVGSKSLLSAPAVIDRSGKKLKINTDYTVSYSANGADFDGKNAEAGTVVTVTVTAKEGGNYTGSKSTTYRVTNKDINKTKITVEKRVYVDDGYVEFTEEMIQNGAIVITEKGTNEKLEYGADYIITHYSGNNKKGTATVTIQGIGEYGGTKDVKFSIVSKKL